MSPLGMISEQTPVEELASRMLAYRGISTIWDAHVAAAAAHGMGEPDLAASLIKLAEAAEKEWLHRQAEPSADEANEQLAYIGRSDGHKFTSTR
jgi:hypothetical protein